MTRSPIPDPRSPVPDRRHEFRLTVLLLASAGAAVALGSWQAAWLPGLLGLCGVPLYLSYRSYRIFHDRIAEERQRVTDESSTQFAIIEALASAIEAKKPHVRSNSRTLQVCVEVLSRAMGMSVAEVDAVKAAALLRDIGNLAVPEDVLRKEGPLTADEQERVRSHARIGANLIASVPFPRPVAPLVHSHHERWDGKGYPDGLAGDAIPLGARILAVADTFTALQADRPHRAAAGAEDSLAIVQRSAGTAFDPHVVSLLVEAQPAIAALVRGRSGDVESDVPLNGPGGHFPAFDEITAAHREADVLRETAVQLGSSQGVFEAMMQVWLKLQEVLPVSCCALFLWSEEAQQFQCRFAAGENDAAVRPVTATTVDELARPLSAPASFFAPADWNVGLESSMACALTLDGHEFGALVVHDVGREVYSDEHRWLLGQFAQRATLVIRNAMTFDELLSGSRTDALTGLPNRRGMQDYVNRELTRAHTVERGELALLVADLNEFKPINDHLGHEVGDRVIQAVARTLRSLIHPDDLCARFAGDEFVLALRGCGPEKAARTAQAIADVVAATRVDVQDGEQLSLSISIGVASFPHDGTTLERLFGAADRRMYEVKAHRRPAAADADVASSPADHELAASRPA